MEFFFETKKYSKFFKVTSINKLILCDIFSFSFFGILSIIVVSINFYK